MFTNVDIVKAFSAFMKENNTSAAFELIDDNAVWHSDEIGAPWSGIHIGKENIAKHFAAIRKETESFKKVVEDYLEKDDTVIEIFSLQCIFKKTKKPFDTRCVCIYKIKNGKIVSYEVLENSLKLHRNYFSEKIESVSKASIAILKDDRDNKEHFLLELLQESGHEIDIFNSGEALRAWVEKKQGHLIAIAFHDRANALWRLAGEVKIDGIILLHPDAIDDFQSQKIYCPAFIVYSTNSNIATANSLMAFDRLRPEIPQFVNDDLVFLLPRLQRFIEKSYFKNPNDGFQLIRADDIKAKFPAPFPGAVTFINQKNLIAGLVRLKGHSPYAHNNMDEVMYVVSGSGLFRHGQEAPLRINAGDLIYIDAFELHEWSEPTDDFCMLFVQLPRKVI